MGTTKAVRGREDLTTGICQYADFISSVVKYFASLSLSRVVLTKGRGQESRSLTSLSFFIIYEEPVVSFDFFTNTMAEVQGESKSSMISISSIWSNSWLTYFCKAETKDSACLIRVWDVLISCSTR